MFDYETHTRNYFKSFVFDMTKNLMITFDHSNKNSFRKVPIHVFYYYIWMFDRNNLRQLPVYIPFDKHHETITYANVIYGECDSQTARFIYVLDDLVRNDHDLLFFYDVTYVTVRE